MRKKILGAMAQYPFRRERFGMDIAHIRQRLTEKQVSLYPFMDFYTIRFWIKKLVVLFDDEKAIHICIFDDECGTVIPVLVIFNSFIWGSLTRG